jgi:hypothetical protein
MSLYVCSFVEVVFEALATTVGVVSRPLPVVVV